MYKHIQNDHAGNMNNVSFSWKVIGAFQKPRSRQLFEAIMIDNEFFRHNIRKICMTEADFQCKFCARVFRTMNELEVHKKCIHTRFPCEKCNYLSFGEYDLKHHYKAHHNEFQTQT